MFKAMKQMVNTQAIVGDVDLRNTKENYIVKTKTIPQVGAPVEGWLCKSGHKPDGQLYIENVKPWKTSRVQRLEFINTSDDKTLAKYKVQTGNSIVSVIVEY